MYISALPPRLSRKRILRLDSLPCIDCGRSFFVGAGRPEYEECSHTGSLIVTFRSEEEAQLAMGIVGGLSELRGGPLPLVCRLNPRLMPQTQF